MHRDRATDPSPECRQQHQQQRPRGTYRFKPLVLGRFSMSTTAVATTTENRSVWGLNRICLRRWLNMLAGLRWWGSEIPLVARAGTGAGENAVGQGRSSSLRPQLRLQKRKRATHAYTTVWGLLVLFASWWPLSDLITSSSNGLVEGASVSVGFGGGCPNACSGHGYCTSLTTETCACHQGWAGGDCSISEFFSAWFVFCNLFVVSIALTGWPTDIRRSSLGTKQGVSLIFIDRVPPRAIF